MCCPEGYWKPNVVLASAHFRGAKGTITTWKYDEKHCGLIIETKSLATGNLSSHRLIFSIH
jgi:hypothetical protein